ncbi:RNA helicase required for poly(A+) mRNA export [Blastocladiella emersonii ATCC 22665]|nr:RNA helicase required for poly(A+) mRNA export [Blastocladiella emersonii ATCC 22665]
MSRRHHAPAPAAGAASSAWGHEDPVEVSWAEVDSDEDMLGSAHVATNAAQQSRRRRNSGRGGRSAGHQAEGRPMNPAAAAPQGAALEIIPLNNGSRRNNRKPAAPAQAPAAPSSRPSSSRAKPAAPPAAPTDDDGDVPIAEDEEEPHVGLYEDFDPTAIAVKLFNRDDPNSPLYSVSRFEDLGLADNLLRGLYAMNFNKPSKIQERALPLLLHNPPTNLIAQSQSGTGKTAAFVLGMLARCDYSESVGAGPQAVCIVNARELAVQVVDVVRQMAVHTEARVALITAGESWPSEGAHIVVGTPGRILDLAQRRAISLSKVKILVVDEADSMLSAQNLGTQASRIKPLVPKTAQIVLFSATFAEKVLKFAERFAPEANLITLAREEVKVDAIAQFALAVPPGLDQKIAALDDIYGLLSVGQSMVFVDRRDDAYRVAKAMQDASHEVVVLTGQDDPAVRDQTMDAFRSGRAKVLISTNVVARGIDIPQVNLVVNFDVPKFQNRPDFESYMHRIGRTGRFGRAGVAINIIDGRESQQILDRIIDHYKLTVHRMPNDFEAMEKLLKEVQAR